MIGIKDRDAIQQHIKDKIKQYVLRNLDTDNGNVEFDEKEDLKNLRQKEQKLRIFRLDLPDQLKQAIRDEKSKYLADISDA